MAGMIAFKHAKIGGREEGLVATASVDRIDILNPFERNKDVQFKGSVTYTGNTSMEVTIRVQTVDKEIITPNLISRFIMVARTSNNEPLKVENIQLDCPNKVKLFEMGMENKKRKLQLQNNKLTSKPPTQEEGELIHRLWLEKIKKKEVLLFPQDTRLSSIRVCQRI